MFSINDIKYRAKRRLEGKYFKYFSICFILFILSLGIELFRPNEYFNLGFEIIVILFNFIIGMYLYIVDLNIANENYKIKPTMDELLSVLIKGILISILSSIVIIVGFILFIVPGIIASILLSQALYILIEDNSKSVTECLIESKTIMDGNILNYFLLQLSFLGSIILGTLTLGIGFYWILPRIQVANAIFYKDIKAQYNKKETWI